MTEYARLVVAVDSTGAKTATRDLDKLSAQSEKTERSVSSLGGTVRSAAAIFGAFKLGQQISEIVTLASRYDQLGLVMTTVGGNVGKSREELDRLEQSLKDTGISALQSRGNIIKMISANIDLSQATELARLAQNAAVVANINSSDAFARLIKGIQSAEKETLETMGLNVNFAQSYEKLAAQLGKNADQLTVVEKVQAGVNAAMEAGDNIAGSYEASMGNALKQWQSSARYLEDFKVALGGSLLDEFSGTVNGYSATLKFLSENVELVSTGLRVGLYAAAGRASVAIGQATVAAVASSAASRTQAIEEVRLAQAHATSTAAALAHARANYGLMGSTGQLTAATIAHEAALRRVTAAQAASMGIGRTLLGIMGGPVGLAVTAGAVALSFVEWGDNAATAARKSVALRQEAELMARAAEDLDAAQSRQVLQNMEEPYQAEIASARAYAAQVEYLNKQISEFPGSPKQEQWQRSLVEAEGNLSSTNQRIAEYDKRMADLSARIEQNTKTQRENNAARAESDTTGLKYLTSLKRQADFAGDLTETQKVLIAIEKGYAGALSETDQQAALTYAGIIDAAAEAARATKTVTTSTKDLVDDYKAVADNLERQIALYGSVSEAARLRYDIENGALQGLATKEAEYIMGLARELDLKNDLTEQERLRIDILRESGQVRAANDAQFQLEYAGKIAEYEKQILEYEKQGNIEGAQRSAEAISRLETLRQIRDIQLTADQAPGTVEGVTQAPDSEGADAMFGGAAGEFAKLEEERVRLDEWRATELEKHRAFLEAKAITKEEFDERERNIQQQHTDELNDIDAARQQVALTATQDMFGTMADLTKQFAGENSAAYKVMFAAEKAIAIARSIMAIQTGIALAAANPFPLNLAAMATVAANTAGIVANIASVGASFEGGGYTGNGPRSGGLDGKGGYMAMVHPQETIIDHTKSGGRSGAQAMPKIQVINNGAPLEPARTVMDGDTMKVILKTVDNHLSSGIASGQGKVNKALERSLNAPRRHS